MRVQISALLFVLAFGTPVLAQGVTPRPRPVVPKTLQEAITQFEAKKALPYAQRYSTVSAFGRFKSDECAVYVANIAKTDKDVNIRRSAISTLGSIGTASARKALSDIATTATDSSTKSAVISALSRLKPLPDRKIFEKFAAPSNDYITRTAAVRGLAAYKDLQAVKTLVSMLQAPAPRAPGAPPNAAASSQGRMNSAILTELRRLKVAGMADYLAKDIMGAPKGKLLWHKKTLIGVLVSVGGKDKYANTFLALTKERDPDLRAEATYALDMKPLPDNVVKRLVALLKDKSDPVAAAAAVVVGKHAPPEALSALVKLATGKSPGRSAAALEALGLYPDSSAFSALKKALFKKKPWQLPAAAIAGFSKRHKPDSIDQLIKVLPKLKGRLHADACKALEKLTGQLIGRQTKDWKNWWKAVKKDFTMPEGEGLAKRPESGGPPVKPREGTVSRNPKYYGSEVVSKRLTFIVDFSGSMSAKMKRDDPKSLTRLQKAKEELSGVIKLLSKDSYFNLVFFGTSYKVWQKTVVPANKKFKKVALSFTQSAPGMGGTNIYDPLEKAMQDPNVDTIYLLSDGAPGSGKFTIPADILREIGKINATRRIVIHTISFGSDSKFLKDLAKANKGNYTKR